MEDAAHLIAARELHEDAQEAVGGHVGGEPAPVARPVRRD